jgi:integrase
LNEELIKEMKILQAARNPECPFIFQRKGKPIKRFSKAWAKACKTAGLWAMDKKTGEMGPSKLFHDFRRTAIRNNVRAGIPERVAMMISGHKTRSLFERYNIVSDRDLKEAAKKQENYVQIQNGYNTVTVDAEKGLEGEAATA